MNHLERSRLCPCGSGKEYDQCCAVFHQGKPAENALQLMRSRYTAYVLDLAEYIIKTTHPASVRFSFDLGSWKRSLSKFSQNTQFSKLEILDFQENKKMASVTFTVYAKQGDEDVTFTEKSIFTKYQGQWLYLEGQAVAGRALDLIPSKPLLLLPIVYYNNPILRKVADPIAEINDEIKNLVAEMIPTMTAYSGMGLAAPQIGHSLRLFIVQAPIEDEKGELSPGEIEVFINPKLSVPSKKTIELEEGCLSIPKVRGFVNRPQEIIVDYMTLEGIQVQKKVSSWEARVIMHENDHLNGVLFIDRLSRKERSPLDARLDYLKSIF